MRSHLKQRPDKMLWTLHFEKLSVLFWGVSLATSRSSCLYMKKLPFGSLSEIAVIQAIRMDAPQGLGIQAESLSNLPNL